MPPPNQSQIISPLISCSYEFMRKNLIFYRTEIHRLTGKVRFIRECGTRKALRVEVFLCRYCILYTGSMYRSLSEDYEVYVLFNTVLLLQKQYFS